MTKYCPACHRALPRSAFHRNLARWDGRAAWCKACVRASHRQRAARQQGWRMLGDDRLTAAVWPPAPRGGEEEGRGGGHPGS